MFSELLSSKHSRQHIVLGVGATLSSKTTGVLEAKVVSGDAIAKSSHTVKRF